MTLARQSCETLTAILDEAERFLALSPRGPEWRERIAMLRRALADGTPSATLEHEIVSIRERAARLEPPS